MDVAGTNSKGLNPSGELMADPRLQPTPDYGTLNPSSDVAPHSAEFTGEPRNRSTYYLLQFGAAILGVVVALLVSGRGGYGGVWKFNSSSPVEQVSSSSENLSTSDLDREKPQRQAEILLERAISHSSAAPSEIESRTDRWRGKLRWDSQLNNLTTAALNSSDRDVQNSGIEVQLAAYGLTKESSTVDGLVRQAESSDHAQKIWALWGLGLLANRGVETDRIVRVLASHLKDSNRGTDEASAESRRWAVEGLALVGTNSTIAPLLDAMHNDPSASVRERAACSLAESGMLSHEQRMIAVPQLISYSDDPALDAQTRTWAFQALADITHQHLPNDAGAWRNWYQSGDAGSF